MRYMFIRMTKLLTHELVRVGEDTVNEGLIGYVVGTGDKHLGK